MGRRPRIAALASLACLALVGCSDDQDSPPRGVVRIGDEAITRADVNHWVRTRATLGGEPQVPLEPPRFAACVDDLRRSRQGSVASFRAECRKQFKTMLEALVEQRWLQQELDRLDLTFDEERLRRTVRARYRQLLADASPGQQPSDEVRRNIRRLLAPLRQLRYSEGLKEQVREALWREDGGASSENVKRFHERYPHRFADPATRRVRILLLPTEARAQAAARALRRGHGWRRYARSIALDAANASSPDGRVILFESQGDDTLLRAVFATPTGHVGGPVRTMNGWYVFSIDLATPRTQSLAAAAPGITQLLVQQRDRRVLREFVNRRRRETICKPNYLVAACAQRAGADGK